MAKANGKKALVFGGSGFLGSYVVDELRDAGHTVTIFDLKPSAYAPDVPFIQGDISDAASVLGAVDGNALVYNFAGLADLNRSIDRPRDTLMLNVLGNLNVLEACRAHGVERYVYASTVYVFSTEGAFYGMSKKAAELTIEEYHRQFRIPYTIVRYGSVYGERADQQNRIHRLIHQALVEKKITFLGDGSEEREYIHGRDAAKLSVRVLEPEFENSHVILTGVERYRYADLLKLIQEILGRQVEIELQHQDYKGHYELTPYTFAPSVGRKLVANPYVDFGQGLLECIEHAYKELGFAKDLPRL
jgi:UDP-glucose 4-epimerase